MFCSLILGVLRDVLHTPASPPVTSSAAFCVLVHPANKASLGQAALPDGLRWRVSENAVPACERSLVVDPRGSPVFLVCLFSHYFVIFMGRRVCLSHSNFPWISQKGFGVWSNLQASLRGRSLLDVLPFALFSADSRATGGGGWHVRGPTGHCATRVGTHCCRGRQ